MIESTTTTPRSGGSTIFSDTRFLRRALWAGKDLFVVWLGLRLFTFVWAALVSPLRPLTQLERAIPIWPPSAPIGQWFERVLLTPWLRWDTNYYLRIVEQGYQRDDGTAQFHPLLAWLATPIAWVTGQPLLGLLVVSSCAGLLMLVAFERLARFDVEPSLARTSTLLLLCSPMAFVLFIPYTEGLFLLWAVLCLLFARQQNWWLAGLAGALATLTRQQGVFLILPLAWELWEVSDRNPRTMQSKWRNWLSLGLIPAGLLVWLVYRAVALNDLNANFISLQALIYSVVVSPSASKVVPQQAFLWPWHALWLAVSKLWREPEFTLAVDLTLGIVFVCLLVLRWRDMRMSYRIYTAVITAVSFAYHTGPLYPYMGLPRHLLLAFPVYIGVAPVMQRPRVRLAAACMGLLAMFFLLMLYVIEGWTP